MTQTMTITTERPTTARRPPAARRPFPPPSPIPFAHLPRLTLPQFRGLLQQVEYTPRTHCLQPMIIKWPLGCPPRLDVWRDVKPSTIEYEIDHRSVVGLLIGDRTAGTAVATWGTLVDADPVTKSCLFTMADIERLSALHHETVAAMAASREADYQTIGEGLQRVIECDGSIQLRRDWEAAAKTRQGERENHE